MAVTRETLHEEVWTEPMTKVAARYGVSSSFLARICERLNVPRPSRGYWAQLEVGKVAAKPALPEARPGGELEWSREGEPRRVPRALPQPPSELPAQRRRRDRPSRHELLVGAREHFEGAKESDSGYLRPLKRRLVDAFVTEAALDQARLQKIVADILFDMETRDRLRSGRGNAMLVAGSVYEACKLYELFTKTPLAGKCAIVTSYVPRTADIKGEESGEGNTDRLEKYTIYRQMLADWFDMRPSRPSRRWTTSNRR